MAREMSGPCDAEIIMCNEASGALFACEKYAKGRCVKDLAREVGAPLVALATGECEVDARDGIVEPATPQVLLERIRDEPGMVGARIFLTGYFMHLATQRD
jgi:hypothetical protein